MGVPTVKTGPMTVEEFYAFTDTRPDEEKWELVDGEPILNVSPSELHQRILWNLAVALGTIERQRSQSWEASFGVGVRVSDTNLPQPDAFIVPAGTIRRDPFARQTRDVLVIFEVLSPSSVDRDLRWKRTAYTGLPSQAGFAERHFRSLADVVELPAFGISLPLSEVYRDRGMQ